MMGSLADRPPVVYVKARERIELNDGRRRIIWVIDCPHCGREHRHGAAPGHRVAHCLGDNPGYILRLRQPR